MAVLGMVIAFRSVMARPWSHDASWLRRPAERLTGDGHFPSGVVAKRRPGPLPGRPQAGGQVERRALLVVADADPVLERRDLPDPGELAAQQRRVQADDDRGGVAGRRRSPQPE